MTFGRPNRAAAEAAQPDRQGYFSSDGELRTILIECVSVGLRVTLMALRVTVSMVMFQKPVLGTLIFAGNLSKAPP